MKEEVDRLHAAGFIQEVPLQAWVANVVLVKKKKEEANGKQRMCVDFTDLNKASPKFSFSLPKIDQLVDLTCGHQLLFFMDAYSGYNNQIMMNLEDEDNTAFYAVDGVYCYKVMPFGLKNAGTTCTSA